MLWSRSATNQSLPPEEAPEEGCLRDGPAMQTAGSHGRSRCPRWSRPRHGNRGNCFVNDAEGPARVSASDLVEYYELPNGHDIQDSPICMAARKGHEKLLHFYLLNVDKPPAAAPVLLAAAPVPHAVPHADPSRCHRWYTEAAKEAFDARNVDMIHSILGWAAEAGGTNRNYLLNDIYVHVLTTDITGFELEREEYRARALYDLVARWGWPVHEILMNAVVNYYDNHNGIALEPDLYMAEIESFISLASQTTSCLLVVAEHWPGGWCQAPVLDPQLKRQLVMLAMGKSRDLVCQSKEETGKPIDPIVFKTLHQIVGVCAAPSPSAAAAPQPI